METKLNEKNPQDVGNDVNTQLFVTLMSTCLREIQILSSAVQATNARANQIYDMLNPEKKWFTVRETAEMVGKSEWVVRDMAESGKLEKRRKDGRSLEISRESINRYLASL